MRYAVSSALAALLLAGATAAEACPRPLVTYSVSSVQPRELAPRNAPLLVHFTQSYYNEEQVDQLLEPSLELRIAGSEELLEVIEPSRVDHSSTFVAFVPKIELAPNTRYSAVARLTADGTPSLGPETETWEFTTSDELRAPLVMEDDWQVSFEPGIDPVYDCATELGSCGPTCLPSGEVAVTKAHLELPSVSGGFSAEHLAGTVSVSIRDASGEQNPLKVTGVTLTAGKRAEVSVSLPLIDGRAFVPCFRFAAWDARGDERVSEWCGESAFPEPPGAGEPPDEDPPAVDPPAGGAGGAAPETHVGSEAGETSETQAGAPARDAEGPTDRAGRTSSSCAMSSGRSTSAGLLAFASLAMLVRLRRRPSAPLR